MQNIDWDKLKHDVKAGTSICVIWNMADIKLVDDSLTNNEVMCVLQSLIDWHDASEGICWCTIECAIERLKRS